MRYSLSTRLLSTLPDRRVIKCFVGFLNASKAFDKVLRVSLFKKLLERGVPVALAETLKNWYGSLRCSVQWNSVLSDSFAI